MSKGWTGFVLIFGIMVSSVLAAGGGVSPIQAATTELTEWRQLLASHVHEGGVDYRAVAADPADLDHFLSVLEGADLSDATTAEQSAFWINAYNAVAIRFVLDRYPDIASVRDVDGFFDTQTAMVAGRSLTLDEIEDLALDAGGARVHFAVNCASESCPELRAEPFEAATLDSQLDDQVERFLRNTKHGMRLDSTGGDLWLSSIFKWYAGDFTGGSTVVAFFMRGGVLDWIVGNAPTDLADPIKAKEPTVRYLEYEWALNDRRTQ